jgi:hypothetical protein
MKKNNKRKPKEIKKKDFHDVVEKKLPKFYKSSVKEVKKKLDTDKQFVFLAIGAVQNIKPKFINERPFHFRIHQIGIMSGTSGIIFPKNATGARIKEAHVQNLIKRLKGDINIVVWHKEEAEDILFDLSEQFPALGERLLSLRRKLIGITELYKNTKGYYTGVWLNLQMKKIIELEAWPQKLPTPPPGLLTSTELKATLKKESCADELKEHLYSLLLGMKRLFKYKVGIA